MSHDVLIFFTDRDKMEVIPFPAIKPLASNYPCYTLMYWNNRWYESYQYFKQYDWEEISDTSIPDKFRTWALLYG